MTHDHQILIGVPVGALLALFLSWLFVCVLMPWLLVKGTHVWWLRGTWVSVSTAHAIEQRCSKFWLDKLEVHPSVNVSMSRHNARMPW